MWFTHVSGTKKQINVNEVIQTHGFEQQLFLQCAEELGYKIKFPIGSCGEPVIDLADRFTNKKNNYFTTETKGRAVLKKKPSEARKKEIDELLWDKQVLRVYCDCSLSTYSAGALHTIKRIGISAVFVFDGSVTVKSKSCHLPRNPNSAYAETEAILFSLSEIPAFLDSLIVNRPNVICIYTDFQMFENHIKNLKTDAYLNQLSDLQVQIEYLGDEKRYNPFHTAAHNAARKVVGKK